MFQGFTLGLHFRTVVNQTGESYEKIRTRRRLAWLVGLVAARSRFLSFGGADAALDDLSLQQARRIFRGEISDWSALGGRLKEAGPRPIHVIGRRHCKLRPGHWRLLLAQQDLFSRDLLEVGTIKDMIASVSTDPLAIGYETLWMVQRYRGRAGYLFHQRECRLG